MRNNHQNFVSTASTFLRQTFDGEYPKLIRVFGELLVRLEQFGPIDVAPPTFSYLASPLVKSSERERVR